MGGKLILLCHMNLSLVVSVPRATAIISTTIDHKVTAEEAETYHREQIRTFKAAGADLVSACTINYVEEATGIVKAAPKEAIYVVISFTVETDGRLPSGQPLGEAITQILPNLHIFGGCCGTDHYHILLNKSHRKRQCSDGPVRCCLRA